MLVSFRGSYNGEECVSILFGGSNRWRRGDNRKVTQFVGAQPESNTWPHDFMNKLGLILRGYKEESMNNFNRFYEMRLRPQASIVSLLGDSGRQNANLLTTPIDHRIVADASIDLNSKNDSGQTDSISLEINKAMYINFLIMNTRKKRKTTAGVARINSTCKGERNNEHLER